MIMKSYLLLFILFTLELAGAELDYTYDDVAGGWLKLHTPAKWDDAEIICSTEVAGSVLASPLTTQLSDAIRQYVQRKDRSVTALYTGVHASSNRGPLVTREGVPVNNLPVPANFDTENSFGCVVWAIQRNELVKINCNNLYPFVCYKSLPKTNDTIQESLLPTTTENTRSNYSTVNGRPRRGQLRCAAEREKVIFINTNLESEHLSEIISRSTNQIKIVYVNQVYITYLNGTSKKIIDSSRQITHPTSYGNKQPSAPPLANSSAQEKFSTSHGNMQPSAPPHANSSIQETHPTSYGNKQPSAPRHATQYSYPAYYTYLTQVSGRLKLYGPANWTEARDQCARDGATLASPLTHPLLDTLKSHVLGVDRSLSTIYTGVQTNFSTGDYVSIEGVPLIKMPVVLDQSIRVNYESSDSCLALMMRETERVRGTKCSDELPFVCYKKKTEVYGCGTLDKQYKYESKSGSCYKFHKQGLTWNKAYEQCVSEGAYLAVIDNQNESQVLRSLFYNNPQSVLKDVYFVDNAFIGLNCLSDGRTWVTSKGTYPTFLNWNNGEPNNANGVEFCGSMHRNGMLYDEPCAKILTFICEKAPEVLVTDTQD